MQTSENLAKETIPANEVEHIKEIVADMRFFLEKKYPPGSTKRHFHPKMHGCVKAVFSVHKDLSEPLRRGLFHEPKEYEAWVRFSSAPPSAKSDRKPTGLGMAIKLLETDNSLLPDADLPNTKQDLLMTTSPILSPGHVSNYRRAMKMIIYGFPHILYYVLDPTNWRRIALTLKNRKRFYNVLEHQYFSGAPILFGKGQAVKYSAVPRKQKRSKKLNNKSDYFLQERLARDLENEEAVFDFMVQFRENIKNEPIEDTSKEWKTPFHSVATLQIPKQSFQNQERIIFGENLFFSPWNCIEGHRPLGGINRARKEVYAILGALRRARNGIRY